MLSIEKITDVAKIIAAEYPIIKIQLFGSYAEGKNNSDSDVDVLIEFDSVFVVTLLTLSKIKNQMEELLQVPVDIITSPIPKDSVLEISKVISLYEA